MPISKEQWQRIEKELSHPYGHVKLKCDSYVVSLSVEMVGRLKYGIVVFVGGVFRGKWLVEDCEERRRFLRPAERFICSPKMRADLTKIWGGKRAPKKELERINEKFTAYFSHWTTCASLRRHLEKNNQELTLLSIAGVDETNAAPASTTEEAVPC